MDAKEYLGQRRDAYIEKYRELINTKHDEGAEPCAEVWVQPNVPPGEQGPAHPLCVDVMITRDGRQEIVMLTSEDAAEGPRVAVTRVGELDVNIYPLYWEVFPVWIAHKNPDWSVLKPWCEKWMDTSGNRDTDEYGLHGLVHYIGRPIAEGGGFLYSMDFGSAPVEAVAELVEILVKMGATAIELGRSDGSDLPADVKIALQQPDLTLDSLASLAIQVLSVLDDVDHIERSGPDELSVFAKGNRHTRKVFIANLHRVLLRIGLEARPKEIYRFLRSHRETASAQGIPDLSQLRPVIKDDRFFAEIKRRAPDMKPLLAQRLAADIWVVGVWDAPNGMRFVTATEPETYGMSAEQMLQRARDNYLKDQRNIVLSKHGPLLVAQTRDCYDASLLLNDAWINQMEAKVDGELLACVPARHTVLIAGASNPQTLYELRDAARRIEKGGDHLISRTILMRRNNVWQEFEREGSANQMQPQSSAAKSQAIKLPEQKNQKWWRFW